MNTTTNTTTSTPATPSSTTKSKNEKLTIWTKHDAMASYDRKIRLMIREFGYEGYGWYWALVEEMLSTNHAPYVLDLTPRVLANYAHEFQTTPERLQSFINLCIDDEVRLFALAGTQLSSPSLQRRMNERETATETRRDRLAKAGKKRWEFRDKTNVEWWDKYVELFRAAYPKSMKSQINDPQVERELFYACLVDGEPDKAKSKEVLKGTDRYAEYIDSQRELDAKYELLPAAKWLKARGWMEGAGD